MRVPAAIHSQRELLGRRRFATLEPSGRIVVPDQSYTDAIALLKADHRKVEQLFEQYEGASSSAEEEARAPDLCRAQDPYRDRGGDLLPRLQAARSRTTRSTRPMSSMTAPRCLINDIEAGSPGDDFYDAKVKVLSEEIKHHVHEEEMPSEGMFAQCRETDVDLVALRDAMLARKQELMAQAESAGLPPAAPRAVNLQPA
jgi:hypothetical protein